MSQIPPITLSHEQELQLQLDEALTLLESARNEIWARRGNLPLNLERDIHKFLATMGKN